MINIQIDKAGSENNAGVIRRFTKRVRESGVINRVRSLRYRSDEESKEVRKKKTLKSIDRKAKILKLIKLGKIKPKPMRRR
jgi:hypothetical protein